MDFQHPQKVSGARDKKRMSGGVMFPEGARDFRSRSPVLSARMRETWDPSEMKLRRPKRDRRGQRRGSHA